jgi:hypothetical protein
VDGEVLTKMMTRSYTEFKRLRTFEERYKYLKLGGTVGQSTFGFDRYLNQMLYASKRWKKTRDNIIIRDNACDLGMEDYDIGSKIFIHHMNPIVLDDFDIDNDLFYDPEFLICTSYDTHNAIHFGDESLLPKLPIERRPNDTCPWK